MIESLVVKVIEDWKGHLMIMLIRDLVVIVGFVEMLIRDLVMIVGFVKMLVVSLIQSLIRNLGILE